MMARLPKASNLGLKLRASTKQDKLRFTVTNIYTQEFLPSGLIFDFSSSIPCERPFSAHLMQFGVWMARFAMNSNANANASQWHP